MKFFIYIESDKKHERNGVNVVAKFEHQSSKIINSVIILWKMLSTKKYENRFCKPARTFVFHKNLF